MTRARELYEEFRALRQQALEHSWAGHHGHARLLRDLANRIACHYVRECHREERPALRLVS